MGGGFGVTSDIIQCRSAAQQRQQFVKYVEARRHRALVLYASVWLKRIGHGKRESWRGRCDDGGRQMFTQPPAMPTLPRTAIWLETGERAAQSFLLSGHSNAQCHRYIITTKSVDKMRAHANMGYSELYRDEDTPISDSQRSRDRKFDNNSNVPVMMQFRAEERMICYANRVDFM